MTSHSDHDEGAHPVLDEPRPGDGLRVARERAGISRDLMAERLHIAQAQFDALERDDYAALPPPAFVRGYLRAYARQLGLDPEEYIAAYNRSEVGSRDPAIHSGGVTDAASSGRGAGIGLLLIALVAAGGVAAWWYQQRSADDGAGAVDRVEEESAGVDDRESDKPDAQYAGDGESGTDDGAPTDSGNDGGTPDDGDTDTASTTGADDTTVDAEAASAAVEEVGSAEAGSAVDGADEDGATAGGSDRGNGADDGEAMDDAPEEPTVATPERETQGNGSSNPGADDTGVAEASGTTSGTDGEQSSAESTAAGSGDDGADTAATIAEPGATSPAATDSPAGAATEAARTGPDEITLEFSSRSWLEVYDDRDRELVYTLYFGSEPITLQGWAPFEIFLGNSPAVTVRFNGKEIDKSSFTRGNNTARFVVDAAGVSAP